MLRKTMIALFTFASVAMLIPDAASARGGGGHGGGGFGGGGGFRGGGGFGGGGGFRGGGMGMGGGGFRAAAVGGGFRSAALPATGFRGGAFAANGFRGAGFHHGFRHHRFPFAGAAIGVGLGYGLYGSYGYDDDYYPYYAGYDDYYGDSGCYIIRRSVRTPYGWRIRPVQVCG
jgi:hypothetical protein